MGGQWPAHIASFSAMAGGAKKAMWSILVSKGVDDTMNNIMDTIT
jgi:hypothetical protein